MKNNQRQGGRISAKMPNLLVGFVIAGLFVIGQILQVTGRLILGRERAFFVLTPVGVAGWIYWFICVYQTHQVLAELTNSTYPIKPAAAVGYHFIPLYNVYWVIKWPAEVARFVNTRLHRRAIFQGTGIFLLVAPFLIRPIGPGIPLLILFSVSLYLSRRILQVIQEGKKIDQRREDA